MTTISSIVETNSLISITSHKSGDILSFSYSALSDFTLIQIFVGPITYSPVSSYGSLSRNSYYIETSSKTIYIQLGTKIAPVLFVRHEVRKITIPPSPPIVSPSPSPTIGATEKIYSLDMDWGILLNEFVGKKYTDIYGEISFNWEIGVSPTATMSLIAANFLTDPLEILGSDITIKIWGHPFKISSLNSSYKQNKQNTIRYLLTNFELNHKTFGANTPTTSLLKLPQLIPDSRKNINLSEVLPAPITVIRSTGTYNRYNPNYGKGVETQTTALQELENLAKPNGCFLLYEAEAIRFLPFTGLGYIDLEVDAVVFKDSCQISKQGDGAKLTDINLAKEYRNAELILDLPPEDTSPGYEIFYEFENCSSIVDAESPSASLTVTYADAKSELTYPTNTFDNGGRTKKVRKIWTYNGTTIRTEETMYGLVYTSEDMYDIYSTRLGPGLPHVWKYSLKSPLGSLSRYWRIVETKTTNFIFDTENYLVKEIVTGNRLTRQKTESEQLELINKLKDYKEHLDLVSAYSGGLWVEIKEQIEREIESYKFISHTPINIETIYVLEHFKNYYKDSSKLKDKFVMRKERKELSSTITTNPKDRPSDVNSPYEPLIKNKEFKDIELVNIITPLNISAPQTPEKYRVTNFQYNKEGDSGGANTLKISTVSDRSGRPSAQTKKTTTIPTKFVPSSYRNKRYFVNSIDSLRYSGVVDPSGVSIHYGDFRDKNSDPLTEETLQYTGADTPDKALTAATVDFVTENFKALQIELDLLTAVAIKPGFIVHYLERDWLLTKMSIKGEIRKKKATVKSIHCTLSYLASPLLLTRTSITA